jgi:hypothetical protein
VEQSKKTTPGQSGCATSYGNGIHAVGDCSGGSHRCSNLSSSKRRQKAPAGNSKKQAANISMHDAVITRRALGVPM